MYILLFSSMSHRKTKFQESWLSKKDGNGDDLSAYIKPIGDDQYHCSCKFCDRKIDIASSGFHAIKTHASTKVHKEKANVFFKRSNQTTIQFRQVADQVNYRLTL